MGLSEQQKMAYSWGRVGIGAAALLAPGIVGRLMGLDLDRGAQVAMRAFGSRDAVVGLGQVLGERHGTARGWYEAAAAVDVLDAVVLAAAAARGDVSRVPGVLTAVLATVAAVTGILAARSGGLTDSLDAELAELTAAALPMDD